MIKRHGQDTDSGGYGTADLPGWQTQGADLPVVSARHNKASTKIQGDGVDKVVVLLENLPRHQEKVAEAFGRFMNPVARRKGR